ncbi:MAG: WYL domain-containing protein [Candidatus Nanopelagicales bacterium]
MESAVWVVLDRDLSRTDPFGVRLEVPQIVQLVVYAEQLLDQEPDNEELRSAIDKLRLTWLPAMSVAARTFPTSPILPLIRRAIVEHRRLQFTYTREWTPGTSTRVVDPYQLRQTPLGYEMDAGPVGADGHIRTFLVGNMSDPEVLDDTFPEPPTRRG